MVAVAIFSCQSFLSPSQRLSTNCCVLLPPKPCESVFYGSPRRVLPRRSGFSARGAGIAEAQAQGLSFFSSSLAARRGEGGGGEPWVTPLGRGSGQGEPLRKGIPSLRASFNYPKTLLHPKARFNTPRRSSILQHDNVRKAATRTSRRGKLGRVDIPRDATRFPKSQRKNRKTRPQADSSLSLSELLQIVPP